MSDAEQEYGTEQAPDEDRHDETEPETHVHADLSEPLGYDEAHALQEKVQQDGDSLVLLFATVEDMDGGAERDADLALSAMRTTTDSMRSGITRAIRQDQERGDDGASRYRGTAIAIENALTQAYGRIDSGRLLARLLTQTVIDGVIETMFPEPDVNSAEGQQAEYESRVMELALGTTEEASRAERARVRAVLERSPVSTLNAEGIEMLTDDIMAALGEGD